jgi:hypothetical protein
MGLRIQVAHTLQLNGWRALALEETWHKNTYPRPDFLAISSNNQSSYRQIQIYIRKPSRNGKLGAGTIQNIIKNSAKLPNWEILITSDRGFTSRALEIGEASLLTENNAPVYLLSPTECIAFLSGEEPEISKNLILEQTRCTTDLIVVGTVTPKLLKNLAKSRSSLERALQNCNPRFLEELVAENWKAEGYEVEIVERLNAGGPDIIATKRDSVVPLKVLDLTGNKVI